MFLFTCGVQWRFPLDDDTEGPRYTTHVVMNRLVHRRGILDEKTSVPSPNILPHHDDDHDCDLDCLRKILKQGKPWLGSLP